MSNRLWHNLEWLNQSVRSLGEWERSPFGRLHILGFLLIPQGLRLMVNPLSGCFDIMPFFAWYCLFPGCLVPSVIWSRKSNSYRSTLQNLCQSCFGNQVIHSCVSTGAKSMESSELLGILNYINGSPVLVCFSSAIFRRLNFPCIIIFLKRLFSMTAQKCRTDRDQGILNIGQKSRLDIGDEIVFFILLFGVECCCVLLFLKRIHAKTEALNSYTPIKCAASFC